MDDQADGGAGGQRAARQIPAPPGDIDLTNAELAPDRLRAAVRPGQITPCTRV